MISKLAIYKRVGKIDDGPRTLKAAAVLHTAVSNASDLYTFWQSGAASPGVGAHFYVNSKGTLYQYLDTDRKTGHAFAANSFSVGIETWDGGDPSIPWNAAQLATIIALLKELGVPGQLLKEGASDGVGYHRLYPSWNLNAHTCPGDARAAQVTKVIIPALSSGGGDDLTDAQAKQLTHVENFAKGVSKGLGDDDPNDAGSYYDAGTALGTRLAGIDDKLDALLAKP